MSSRRVSSSLILHFRGRKEEERGGWGGSSGQGTAEQTEGTERERERGEEVLRSSTSSSSASVPRNLSEPVYLGGREGGWLALRARWVLSFSDR